MISFSWRSATSCVYPSGTQVNRILFFLSDSAGSRRKKKVFSHPCNDLFASHSPSSVWCLSHLLLIFPHLSLNPWTLLRMPGVMQFCFVMWQQIYSSWTSTERPCQSRSAVGPAQASENQKPLGNCLCFVRLDETKQLPWTLGICLSLIYTHSLI